jgi:phosphatidylinositol kinase/protein kinase (PI-3  family)
MRVLRDNVDSVLAVLEAFAHDPLIDWFVKVRQGWSIMRIHSNLLANGHSSTCPNPKQPQQLVSRSRPGTAARRVRKLYDLVGHQLIMCGMQCT